jgi:glycosyltransferase involved in cell wall biosynthesis
MVPKVSIITAAYNATETLFRAVASVRSQSYGDWEHILVNDGSQDHTSYFLKRLQLLDPRVRVFNTQNRGQPLALNTGIVNAQGEYITFLDADDEFKPQHLAKHVSYMEINSDVDLLWGGLEVIADDPSKAYLPDMERPGHLIHAEDCCITGTLFGRKKVFNVFHFDNNRNMWFQDYELLQRAKQQFTVEQFKENTYRYYRNTGSSIMDHVLSQ